MSGWLDDAEGFYVADDGSGIPEADRDSVFEHGYTTTDEGSGFGMTIVERFADVHGWAITDSDTSGAKICFCIT